MWSIVYSLSCDSAPVLACGPCTQDDGLLSGSAMAIPASVYFPFAAVLAIT